MNVVFLHASDLHEEERPQRMNTYKHPLKPIIETVLAKSL
jgi:hypothetical protein